MIEMSKKLSTYFGEKNSESEAYAHPTLKFQYIWQNLDNLFEQMSQEAVNELNLKFITLAMEKVNNKQ